MKHKSAKMVELANSMARELDFYWSLGENLDNGTNSCIIYKVPQHIREINRLFYEPCMLSIGPYHHGATGLKAMEKEKWGYLDMILKINCGQSLQDYLMAIGELLRQARSCYSENIEKNDEDFLLMLLLDGCFILVALGGLREIFQQVFSKDTDLHEIKLDNAEGQSCEEKINNEASNSGKEFAWLGSSQTDIQDDKSNEQPCNHAGYWFSRFINHDLLLLENQIPFFIVKKIFELVAGNRVLKVPFTDEIAQYVEVALRWYPKAITESQRPKDFHHLLHLCHTYFRPTQKPQDDHDYQFPTRYISRFLSFGRKYLRINQRQEDREQGTSVNSVADFQQAGQQLNRWRRAAQYLEAGVKFKKRDYDKLIPHALLDIRFHNSAMELPCLVIDEYTATLFRNLVAFEQTCPQFGDDFTAYIVFLSQLISMPEDVTLLAQREIIVHHLDSDEQVSDLVTLLSKDVVFDFNGNYYLKSLCQTMEAHYQSRINRWVAWLLLNHFSNPWLAVGAFATVVVLICTILQTVYGIMAYVNPPE